jgi:uncharacterized protein (TIGR02117 family)
MTVNTHVPGFRSLVGVIMVCTLPLGIGGCVAMPVNSPVLLAHPRRTRAALGPSPLRVWVLRVGWHTGLVLSRATTGHTLFSQFSFPPQSRFLVFGWGNRKFYTAAHPGIWTALSALFPSTSVVLVQACRRKPPVCLGTSTHLRPVTLSQKGVARLRRYLERTLKKTPAGHLEPISEGPAPQSEFFVSKLSYDAFHTCNTWTAEALSQAGLPVTSTGVLFAFQLWEQLPRPADRPPSERISASGSVPKARLVTNGGASPGDGI